MRVLLDTHSFLWFVAGDMKLSARAREAIEESATQRYLSVASVWEIVIKSSLKKLPVNWTFTELLEDHIFGNDIEVLGIESADFSVLEALPQHHRDPFDRMIIAQAMAEDMPVIGADAAFDDYEVDLLW